jgi:hypothetical protein
MHLWEAEAYLFRELHHLLKVVIVDDTSASGLMSVSALQQEPETVVTLLAEVSHHVPASLQHDFSTMTRVVELALPFLLHFAHLLEDRH